MERIKQSAYVLLIARLVLSATFLMAALPKIEDPVAFASSIEAYRVVSGQPVFWAALLLPWLELVVGFGLIIPQLRRASGGIITCLLLVFIGLHVSTWARGLDINCGCFGQSADENTTNYLWLMLRNGLLLIAALVVFIRDLKFARNPLRKEDVHVA